MHWTAGAAAALAMTASSAAAEPRAETELCRALATIQDAAREPEPLQSLKGPVLGVGGGQFISRLVIPGFAGYCSVARFSDGHGGSIPSLTCHRSLAPPELTARGLTAATAACLSATPRTDYDAAVFEAPPLHIRIDEDGTERSHVGRTVSYEVQVRDAP